MDIERYNELASLIEQKKAELEALVNERTALGDFLQVPRKYRLEYGIWMDSAGESGGHIQDFETTTEKELFEHVARIHSNYGILHRLYEIGYKDDGQLMKRYKKSK